MEGMGGVYEKAQRGTQRKNVQSYDKNIKVSPVMLFGINIKVFLSF